MRAIPAILNSLISATGLLTICCFYRLRPHNGHHQKVNGKSCGKRRVMCTSRSIQYKLLSNTTSIPAGPKDAKAKAAKKAALQGAHGHSSRKTRYSVTFHRPKTLKLARDPKYPRKSIPHVPRMDQFRTIVS